VSDIRDMKQQRMIISHWQLLPGFSSIVTCLKIESVKVTFYGTTEIVKRVGCRTGRRVGGDLKRCAVDSISGGGAIIFTSSRKEAIEFTSSLRKKRAIEFTSFLRRGDSSFLSGHTFGCIGFLIKGDTRFLNGESVGCTRFLRRGDCSFVSGHTFGFIGFLTRGDTRFLSGESVGCTRFLRGEAVGCTISLSGQVAFRRGTSISHACISVGTHECSTILVAMTEVGGDAPRTAFGT
jgi:hypothetical protein